MTNLMLPNITASTPEGQLNQMHSYLYRLVEQLNVAFLDVEKKEAPVVEVLAAADPRKAEEQKAQATFNSIKALIIKSADIINSYMEVIRRRLEGEFVAQSDFGTYSEQTSQDIEENSEYIDRVFNNVQKIITDLESLEHSIIEVNAHIKSGLLYYDESGAPVYGLEVGQRNTIDGVEVFNKYARFTSDRLSFYDQNDNEVAYVSDRKLYITIVEVTGSLIVGGLVSTVRSDKSVVRRWVVEGG